MAFGVGGNFLPSTVGPDDPHVITASATVPVGAVAMLFITHDTASVDISSISDSSGNSWEYTRISNSNGFCGIAYSKITSQITSGSSTVTVNWASTVDAIIRGTYYTGITDVTVGTTTKSATGTNYNVSWTSDEDCVAFACFGFPVDYGFADDSIAGWTQVAVTDDGSDQSQQIFRNEVTAGVTTASNTSPSVVYLAVGVSLAYARPSYGQAVAVL